MCSLRIEEIVTRLKESGRSTDWRSGPLEDRGNKTGIKEISTRTELLDHWERNKPR